MLGFLLKWLLVYKIILILGLTTVVILFGIVWLSQQKSQQSKSITDITSMESEVKYEKDDIVTRLKCDDKHYFHTECIKRWIE